MKLSWTIPSALRSFFINSRKPIEVYADKPTSNYLAKTFSYIFKSFTKEYPATLKLNKLKNEFVALDIKRKVKIKSVEVDHGKIK